MAGVRRNILAMPLSEVQQVTAAFNALKANGSYDNFIRRHMQAMNTATPAGSSRNAAHRGPSFLPWHRAALLEMEAALQAVDPGIAGLPYWKWEDDALNGSDPRRSVLWTADYLGTDGDPNRSNRVLNGPFANWYALLWNNTSGTFVRRSTPGLVRRIGRDPAGSTRLPDPASVTDALTNYSRYDVSPWSSSVSSFRNRLEGWSSGPRLHNLVHRFVGGDMLAGTSPNDPAFWLNHCNVDRLWWQWQGRWGINTYQPVSGGPVGHNLNDPMGFLITPRTPASVLNSTTLNVSYV